MITLCIAGKNNIAVSVLEYSRTYLKNISLVFTPNRTDIGTDGWQKSALKYCRNNHIDIVRLEDLYNIENLVFLSTEYDRLIKTEKFKTKRLFNIHFSLLPKYKGMYTSAWPILNGENESGVTLHIIRDGIDTGEIIDQVHIPISFDMNGLQLYERYIEEGTKLAEKNLVNLLTDNYVYKQQSAIESTYYPKESIDYSSLRLNINATAYQIHNQIRAFAFKPYQLLKYKDYELIGSEITTHKSQEKPGTILSNDNKTITVATIDYNIIMFKNTKENIHSESTAQTHAK